MGSHLHVSQPTSQCKFFSKKLGSLYLDQSSDSNIHFRIDRTVGLEHSICMRIDLTVDCTEPATYHCDVAFLSDGNCKLQAKQNRCREANRTTSVRTVTFDIHQSIAPMAWQTLLAIDTVGILRTTQAVSRRPEGDMEWYSMSTGSQTKRLRIAIADRIAVHVAAAAARLTRSPHARHETFGITEVAVVTVLASVPCSETMSSTVI